MELLHEADVPPAGAGRTFRHSAARASLGALLFALGGIALLAAGRVKHAPPAYFAGAVVLLLLWAFRNVVRARFRPTNWLVQLGDAGLYIKFRSYLNHHLPEHDPTVAFIPFREIRLARLVRELRYLPDSDRGGSTARRRTLVELELRDDAPALAQALDAERRRPAPKVTRWYGSSSIIYREYPVTMPSPRRVLIEWAVVPGAAELLRVLAAYADVHAADVTRDYRRLKRLGRDEQEQLLRQLVEEGQSIAAARIARSLYGCDLAQARVLVDGLVRRDLVPPRASGAGGGDR